MIKEVSRREKELKTNELHIEKMSKHVKMLNAVLKFPSLSD